MSTQPPLFIHKLKSERKLSDYLYLDRSDYTRLRFVAKNEPLSLYKFWKANHRGKKREFFKCNPEIYKIHKRLHSLLSKHQPPEYLKSGVKKESYLTNAKCHFGNKHFYLVDIKGFYPATTHKLIKKNLITKYETSSNVAESIANFVTAKQENADGKRALITGSPLSQYFVFFINKHMFDEMYELSNMYGITFSVYVDDLTFSSKMKIPNSFERAIYNIIKKNSYLIHRKKTKKAFLGRKTEITGIRFSKYGLFITYARKQRIKEKREKIFNDIKINGTVFNKDIQSLVSMLQQASLVNNCYNEYKVLLNDYILNKIHQVSAQII